MARLRAPSHLVSTNNPLAVVSRDHLDSSADADDVVVFNSSGQPAPEDILRDLFHGAETPFVCGPNKDEPAGVDRLLAKRAIVLFFGASWHEPCVAMSRALSKLYGNLKSSRRQAFGARADSIEVVFVTDNSKETPQGYNEFTKDMPWLCTVLQDAESNSKLRKTFGVSSFPHVVVLDEEVQILHIYANRLVVDDPDGALFPWLVSNDANEMPIVTRIRRVTTRVGATTSRWESGGHGEGGHDGHDDSSARDGHDSHDDHHSTGRGFYNPPKLNCKVTLNKNGEMEDTPKKFCCCTFTTPRAKVEAFEVLEPVHDWFAIFFDLIFVGVAFKLGLELKNKANLTLYGCFVTVGLFIPLFQTWVRTVKYANLFSGATDIYTTMFSQAGLTIAAVGISLMSGFRMGSGYHWNSEKIDFWNPNEEESLFYLSAAHALANTIGLLMIALNYALAWYESAIVREHCASSLIGAAISLGCIWLGVFLVFPFKGFRGVLPMSIPHITARFGEFTMLIIGEGVLSLIVGIASRMDAMSTECILMQACCNIQNAGGVLTSNCLSIERISLGGAAHLLGGAAPVAANGSIHNKLNCPPSITSPLHTSKDCTFLSPGASQGHAEVEMPINHLHFGQSILSHMGFADYVVVIFGIHILYLIHIMYFSSQPHDVKSHAMRRKALTGTFWMFAHVPMLAFILIFGVSFKAILYLNEDLGKGRLTLKYALFMAFPCTLLYWNIEFIKLTHSGFFNLIARGTKKSHEVEDDMDKREVQLGWKFTLFRVLISSSVSIVPFLECVLVENSMSNSSDLLAAGGGGNETSFNRAAFWHTECNDMEPYMLVLIVWFLSVFNVISFQLETHLREKVRNETVGIDFEAEANALSKSWPTLARLSNADAKAKSEIAPRNNGSRLISESEMSGTDLSQVPEPVQA